jgi:hypothetical protein
MFGLTSGHVDLSDSLLLIAFVVFVLDVVLRFAEKEIPRLSLISVGLALLALAFYVL